MSFEIHQHYLLSKRAFDTVFSIALLIALTPIFLLISLAIVADDGGPVIYRQERLGLCGVPFVMYKFRTMKRLAEADTGPVWALNGDTRRTRFGAMLRRTRADELPQLINVLAGDMSFIGPRPERPALAALFSQEIPHFSQRLQVRPGITGLAQINGGYELPPSVKLQYDLEYIQNMEWALDLTILAATLKVLLDGTGAR